MQNDLITRLRAAASTDDHNIRNLLREAANELERLEFAGRWSADCAKQADDARKEAMAEVERLTVRLTRLSIAADAVSKASQAGGGMTTELAQLDGALWRAKEEAPGVRGAIEEVDRLKAQNSELNGKLIDIRESLYGKNLQVSGWHLNGALEPLDSWFEGNDWEPITNPPEASSQLVDGRSNSDRGGSGYDREVLGQNNEGDTVTV